MTACRCRLAAVPAATHVPAQQAPRTPAAASRRRRQPATPATVPGIGGAQPTLARPVRRLGRLYRERLPARELCFALAKPAKAATNPPNRPRDPAYMFISSRPAEKVKDEVSIMIGYGFKPNS